MIQTVRKRDGRIVGYNEEKIKAAIRKAMFQTEKGEDEALIQKITDHISMKGREQMTVEEIQDMVELELMSSPRKEVAKKYIAYRDQRSIARRAKTRDAQLLVETRLNFTQWVPDGFGTGDACIIADGCLEIIDFKYGKGVKVSAYENPQMKIYALGAYEKFSFEYNIDRVRMTIVQPRIDNLSEFELKVTDLLSWAETELKPKAEEAYNGKGKQLPGVWCQFCKVKAQCKALTDTALNLAKQHQDPNLLTPEEIAADVLPFIDIVKSWLTGIEEYTLQAALNGTNYPGYKIVAGRSIRKITDQQAVMTALNANMFDEAAYMKPRELRSITDLEKLVGKKRFAEICGDWIEKPQGKPTLVPESDKRPAYDTTADDFKDVNV